MTSPPTKSISCLYYGRTSSPVLITKHLCTEYSPPPKQRTIFNNIIIIYSTMRRKSLYHRLVIKLISIHFELSLSPSTTESSSSSRSSLSSLLPSVSFSLSLSYTPSATSKRANVSRVLIAIRSRRLSSVSTGQGKKLARPLERTTSNRERVSEREDSKKRSLALSFLSQP